MESAAALVEAGAEVDARDRDGNTPLWRATFASRGAGDVIALLRAHGADPHAENGHGVSPLALAERIGNYDVRRHFADVTGGGAREG
jgi:ankyrin repeat protein